MIEQKIQSLDKKERRGSRPRCILITNDVHATVVSNIDSILEKTGVEAQVLDDDGAETFWPRGFAAPAEIQIDKTTGLLSESDRDILKNWWLRERIDTARTPVWDLVAKIRIDGREGLLLVEAKAHRSELSNGGKTFNQASDGSKSNHAQITQAIAQANDALSTLGDGWNLSPGSHYQLANRFAWAWKLASMGIPVVLVYLGFIGATDVTKDADDLISSEDAWNSIVREHASGVVPEDAWTETYDINGTSFAARVVAIEFGNELLCQ